MTPGGLRRAAGVAVALAAVAGGAWQRARAVRELPPDYDELVYIPVGYRYAERIGAGRAGEIATMEENYEHPPMGKLVHAAATRVAGAPEPDWKALEVGRPLPDAARPAFRAARWPSAVAGLAQVAIVAALSPLAGLLLAFDPYHAKYTSQAMLEAVPGLLALVAALLAGRALRADGRRRTRLALLSAAAVGAAAAGKYPYGLVLVLALSPLAVAAFPRRPGTWLALGGVLVAVFLALAPNLWPDPIGGIARAVAFHWSYSHGEHVAEVGYPWYAPLFFLTHPVPLRWHPGVFATGAVTWGILPLAAVGLPRTWRRRPVFAAWAIAGLAFLLLWRSKWPQYLLMVLPALAVCAAEAPAAIAAGARWVGDRVSRRRSRAGGA
ncbi:MAG TPA: hypothetical protein VLS93_18035 [Anaeromyxobacteraceae bacterium]|nr:hypothetical protein [Anaeromyxobacteraceae bacterium]